jgi:hypothetical protein
MILKINFVLSRPRHEAIISVATKGYKNQEYTKTRVTEDGFSLSVFLPVSRLESPQIVSGVKRHVANKRKKFTLSES